VPDLTLTAIATQIIDPDNVSEEALAKANMTKQKDLMYVAYKLVHAGTNQNKDHFTEDELITAQNTPKLKGINWGHTDENIGVIYDTEYVKATDEEPAHIVAAAAIWKYKHPQRASEMMRRFAEGNLFFSMEVWFDEAQCSSCNKVFESKARASVCSHLQSRFGTFSQTSRILKGLTFGGAGVVEEPADPLAVGLAVANRKAKSTMEGVKLMEDIQKELQEAKDLATKAEAKVVVLEDTVKTAEESLAETNEKVTELTTELETKGTELEEAQKSFTELQEKYDAVSKELEGIKSEAEAVAKATERCDTLAKAGVGPKVGDEGYDEHFNRMKALDDTAFDAVLEVLKSNASVESTDDDDTEDADDTPDSAEAGKLKLPTGDVSTDSEDEGNLPYLRKLMGVDNATD